MKQWAMLNRALNNLIVAVAMLIITLSMFWALAVSINYGAFSLFGGVLIEQGATTLIGVLIQIMSVAVTSYLCSVVITVVSKKPKSNDALNEREN